MHCIGQSDSHPHDPIKMKEPVEIKTFWLISDVNVFPLRMYFCVCVAGFSHI